MVFLLIFLTANTASLVNKGNKYYKKGDYNKAIKHYQDAGIRTPDNPYIQFNLGDALYKKQALKDASNAYIRALSSGNKRLKEKALFNLGNTYLASDSLKQAINSYISTLLLNPKNMKAKRNLEIALRKMKQKRKQQKQNKNKNKNKKNKNKKQKQEKKQSRKKKRNQNLQQILNAIKQNQKKALRKMMKQKGSKKTGVMDW